MTRPLQDIGNLKFRNEADGRNNEDYRRYSHKLMMPNENSENSQGGPLGEVKGDD